MALVCSDRFFFAGVKLPGSASRGPQLTRPASLSAQAEAYNGLDTMRDGYVSYDFGPDWAAQQQDTAELLSQSTLTQPVSLAAFTPDCLL
jgi:hypothetical protein